MADLSGCPTNIEERIDGNVGLVYRIEIIWDLMLGNSSLSFTIPEDPPIPTVSLNYSGSVSVQEGNTVAMTNHENCVEQNS